MAKQTFRFGKLVRDHIVRDIEAEGVAVSYHVMDQATYGAALDAKIDEELAELREAITPDEITAEIGDVMEVLLAYGKAHGVTAEAIEAAREKKATRKGKFEERVFIDTIELDADHPKLEYYTSQPEKYAKVG